MSQLSTSNAQPLEIGAAYIRVSTDDQTELSPDAQLRMILERQSRRLRNPQGIHFRGEKGYFRPQGRQPPGVPAHDRHCQITEARTIQAAVPLEILPLRQKSGRKHLLQGHLAEKMRH